MVGIPSCIMKPEKGKIPTLGPIALDFEGKPVPLFRLQAFTMVQGTVLMKGQFRVSDPMHRVGYVIHSANRVLISRLI